MVRRFTQHRHGHTNHDEAWKDIEKLWFVTVPKSKDLTQIERDEICRFRTSGKRLRNRALNFGHNQPSSIDAVIPVEDQQSWVLGNGPYKRIKPNPQNTPVACTQATRFAPKTNLLHTKSVLYQNERLSIHLDAHFG